jgi:hypothetical protein
MKYNSEEINPSTRVNLDIEPRSGFNNKKKSFPLILVMVFNGDFMVFYYYILNADSMVVSW